MTVTQPQARLTPEEYLAFERASTLKHEYVNGRVYAMSGASEAHNLIVLSLASALHVQMRGRPCRVYTSDMRVKVSPAGRYTYPDVVALCGERKFEDAHVDTLLNPSVIVEVLSESTERFDRGDKFVHYRRLESLREYVLVSQDRVQVERYVRDGPFWVLVELSDPDAVLELPSVGCAVPLRDIYERVEFGSEGTQVGRPPDQL